jgi:hypothetical protein
MDRPKEAKMGPRESFPHFEARVLRRTGFTLGEIPQGTEEDVLAGHIFCKFGNLYVVGVGYPDQDEEGEEFYSSFRQVTL